MPSFPFQDAGEIDLRAAVGPFDIIGDVHGCVG
jgi:hypothetical protein